MDSKGLAFLITLISLLFNSPAYASQCRAVFLYAGEGDAAYIETPEHMHILIDTGDAASGPEIAKKLSALNVKRLDAIIVTHPHEDHYGGVFDVLKSIGANALYDNADDKSDVISEKGYDSYVRMFRRSRHYRPLKAGDSMELGGASIDILWPRKIKADPNNNSLIMRINCGGISILFMADANSKAEREIINQYDLKSDVLKVGHHGSSDATSVELLNAVSPRYAVVSAAATDSRGYPSAEVVERIKASGITLFETYRHGDIEFMFDNGNASVIKR